MRTLILNKDSLTAKTVANELISRADSMMQKARSHPDWRKTSDVLPGTISYINIDYLDLNYRLRDSISLNSDQFPIYRDLLEDMQPLSNPFNTFRFLGHDPKYKEGETITSKSFWSTTIDFRSFRSGWKATSLLFLLIPRGTHAIMVQGFYKEKEIILPPGTQFKIRHKVTNYDDGFKENYLASSGADQFPEYLHATFNEIYVVYVKAPKT